MKKYLSLAIVSTLLFLTTGCSSQNNNKTAIASDQSQTSDKLDKIELTERTRGTNRLITFSKNKLTVNLNGNIATSPITSQDWKSISQELSFIQLEKINTYESPTTGRYSDAALASTITIGIDGKIYSSLGFDSGQPPAELKSLYNKLKKITSVLAENK